MHGVELQGRSLKSIGSFYCPGNVCLLHVIPSVVVLDISFRCCLGIIVCLGVTCLAVIETGYFAENASYIIHRHIFECLVVLHCFIDGYQLLCLKLALVIINIDTTRQFCNGIIVGSVLAVGSLQTCIVFILCSLSEGLGQFLGDVVDAGRPLVEVQCEVLVCRVALSIGRDTGSCSLDVLLHSSEGFWQRALQIICYRAHGFINLSVGCRNFSLICNHCSLVNLIDILCQLCVDFVGVFICCSDKAASRVDFRVAFIIVWSVVFLFIALQSAELLCVSIDFCMCSGQFSQCSFDSCILDAGILIELGYSSRVCLLSLCVGPVEEECKMLLLVVLLYSCRVLTLMVSHDFADVI